MPASIVHLYKGYPPVLGGIEGHVDLLTRLLGEQGIGCEVICARARHAPRIEQRGPVLVRRCFTPVTFASTPLPPFLPLALHRSSAAIVHLHYPWPPSEVAWMLGGRSRPLVITVHCDVVRHARLARLLAPLTQSVFRRAARILVTGSFMRDVGWLQPHRERVDVVPLGVDTNRFEPRSRVDDPLPDVGRPRILFVGQMRHYKGLPVLARALSLLPHARLVAVGSGPAQPELKSALRANGCADRAHLVGEVDEASLIRIYQTSDVAVLSSTSTAEAFGLSIAEAQSCGLPAVTTAVGTGTEQTVADGISGRVVPPNDPHALAEALGWCLDPSRAAALRVAARAHAVSNLNAYCMTDAVREVYDGITEARTHPPCP
jgi:rhamnosyl/mannosyltransferase